MQNRVRNLLFYLLLPPVFFKTTTDLCCLFFFEIRWYHGEVDGMTAEQRLKGCPPGSFLIRLSGTDRTAMVITKLPKEGGGAPTHQRFFKSKGMGYTISVGGEEFRDVRLFDSLLAMVDAVSAELGMVSPCPNGSVFAAVFETERGKYIK